MTDWGQNLTLGSGITGSYRPFQARLRNALVQACQANRGQVKWKALTDWLAQRVDSETVQADTGIGAIVSRSASFRYGFSNPWVCHCCCKSEVVASSGMDAAHLIPCHKFSSFVTSFEMSPVQAQQWTALSAKVAALGTQRLLATPLTCIVTCKTCNPFVEKLCYFSKESDGHWHRYWANANHSNRVGDSLEEQFEMEGMADVLAVHKLLVQTLFCFKLVGQGWDDDEELPSDSEIMEQVMFGPTSEEKLSVKDWVRTVAT